MILNSIEFLFFFCLFFVFYWFFAGKNQRIQNLFLLIGSYVFYAWWDWRFLFLLILSSFANYILGIQINKTENTQKQKPFLYIGLLYNLLILVYFKYMNFFITSFVDLFSFLNIDWNFHTLHIILPLGISFYTFKNLSYLIDIYNGKLKATTDCLNFFSYVSFFPTLMAGPIDRARDFLPQLEKYRQFDFDKATSGLKQILWGLFKKMVIADNCAVITNQIFDNYTTLPFWTLLFGAFYYTIQIYADFSGYSDMAIGVGRLLGFNVTRNFNYPYFSQNIAHYWRNWHISLTSWLTEYVFTPLSIRFRDHGKWGIILAIVVNFTLVGIWHGANWTFVLFGLIHAFCFIPLIINNKMNKRIKPLKGTALPPLKVGINILLTFILVMFINIVFRADSVSHAFAYLEQIFTFSRPELSGSTDFYFVTDLIGNPREILVILMIGVCFIVEWIGKETDIPLNVLTRSWNLPMRWLLYYGLLFILFFLTGDRQEFIYFRF